MSHNINHTFEKRDILHPDVNGFVEEKFLRYVLVEEVRNSKLSGYIPIDAAQYGIFSGAPEEWADYFVATAKSRSGLNAFNIKKTVRYTEDGTRLDIEKVGLFNINPASVVPSKDQLFVPRVNIREGIQLYTTRIVNDGIPLGVGTSNLSGSGTTSGIISGITTEGFVYIITEDGAYITIE